MLMHYKEDMDEEIPKACLLRRHLKNKYQLQCPPLVPVSQILSGSHLIRLIR